MKNIANNITDLIGNTPMLYLKNYCEKNNVHANIIAKLEYFNPSGSVKDRAAFFMIEDAVKKGILKEGATIIEPTSGNTGIGLASIGASKGYRVILTMPDTMSKERINILKAFGAEIVLTKGALGMNGAINKAKELLNEIDNSFMPSQFDNKANVLAHEKTTALEILEDTDKKVDIFVAGVGTSGTLIGVGKVLKDKIDNVKIVAVEPKGSPVLSKGTPGKHAIQGIGAGFVPSIYDESIPDEIIAIKDEDAFKACRDMAKLEGVLVGMSSGAALCASLELAKREENRDKNIVVLLPDSGQRYLSTNLYEE